MKNNSLSSPLPEALAENSSSSSFLTLPFPLLFAGAFFDAAGAFFFFSGETTRTTNAPCQFTFWQTTQGLKRTIILVFFLRIDHPRLRSSQRRPLPPRPNGLLLTLRLFIVVLVLDGAFGGDLYSLVGG